MTDPATQLDYLKERIRDSDEITDDDRDALLKFDRRMKLLDSKYGDHRRVKLLRHATRIAENVGGLADSLEQREAAEEIVLWIKDEYENEYTKHDYRTALRMFGEHVSEGEGKPRSIEWIPSGTSRSHSPVPDPAKMLEWDADVKPMIEETKNARDAALIAVAFDSGARSGELQDLRVGDVNDHPHGLQIRVDGKTGERSVLLIPSVPYLQRWVNSDHPSRDDPTAPLWSKLNSADEMSYRAFKNIFENAADRAGVKKPVTPTNFRKSNATFLARKGYGQSFIEDRQGRTRGSDATAHYVARFGGEADDEYARLHGVEVEQEEAEPFGPVECPRCGKQTPRDENSCVVWTRTRLRLCRTTPG